MERVGEVGVVVVGRGGLLCGPHLCLHPRSQSKRGSCLTNQKQSHIQVKSPCCLFDPGRMWMIFFFFFLTHTDLIC